MRTGSAWIIEIVGLLGLLGAVSSAAAAPATVPPDAAEYFEKHVRPVLAQNCDTCHGEKMQMAGLRLDSLQAILKGGDSKHTILAPGDPAKSALIQAIEYTGDVKMPPPGKLSEADIQALTAWVKMGAPWPEEKSATGAAPAAYVPPAAAAKHWAFLPVHKPTIPTVKNRAWVKTPVDAFILAKLESKGLTPAKPADRRTLLRRVTFDLTGLPPTPEEMDAFLKDRSSGAYARVVDRLLASPHYGERWGRYWLDIARYSDTKGYVFVEDRSYPYAYTYRDWVIHAFNKDMPYDKFLMEQIAADQLPLSPDKHELAAMGFLTVGRRFLNNPPDIIDDRIDVVCRGMMALTVGCARCHDHKFDPIPQKDYYSLYGVFASSDEPKDLPVIAPRATRKRTPSTRRCSSPGKTRLRSTRPIKRPRWPPENRRRRSS